jgi:hypothetical protein
MATDDKDKVGDGSDVDRSSYTIAENPFHSVSSDEFLSEIAESAKVDAIHSNPPASSVVLPAAVQAVKAKLRKYNQEAVHKCQDEMQIYEQSIDRLKNAFTMPSLRNKCVNLRSELASAVENSAAARLVVEKKREFDRSKRDLEFFQKLRDVVRLPEQGTEIHLSWYKNPWIILPIIVLIESFLMSFTMGQNAAQLQVWSILIIVSVVNIAMSFLVGRYQWNYMTHHWSSLTRFSAKVLVPLYAYVILHMNVGLGAFRQENHLTTRDCKRQGVECFQTDGLLWPWPYLNDLDFVSWITVVGGICFALFALIKGIQADDKKPTYSQKFRACKKKQEDVRQALDGYQFEHERRVMEFRDEMERFLPAAIGQIDQWGKYTNTAQRRFVDYEQWIPKLETAYKESWGTYVAAHEKSRLSDYQVPEIFTTSLQPAFDGENMEPSYIFSDVADIVMSDSEREGKMANFKADCHSIFAEESKMNDEKISELDRILKNRIAAGECHI